MANPNIVSVNSIYGNTTVFALTTTLTNVLLANATASGKVLKIESVMVANVTSAVANVTVQIHTAANGTAGSSFAFANVISVPTSATLSVIDKTNTFYLMENQSIIGGASANSALQVVIAYEDIS
jgi:hypothetical protein